MPISEARATKRGTFPMWIVGQHMPIAESPFINDLWLVPALVPIQSWIALTSLAPAPSLRAAITFAGEGPVRNGYDLDTLRASFYQAAGDRRDEPAKYLATVAHGLGPFWVPGKALVLLRTQEPFYTFQDSSQALSRAEAKEVGGERPFSYWQERDLHHYLDLSSVVLRYRAETLSWPALKKAGEAGEDAAVLTAASPSGLDVLEQTFRIEATRLRRRGAAWPARGKDELVLPLRTPIRVPVRGQKLHDVLSTPDVSSRFLAALDDTPSRGEIFGAGAVFPASWNKL